MLALNAPFSRATYLVTKAFRFRGKDFVKGEEFDTRLRNPAPQRLNELYRDGFLSLPDRKADAKYRKERLAAMENWQPPGPVTVPAAQPIETPLYGEDHED
jgi:hypothetical protein